MLSTASTRCTSRATQASMPKPQWLYTHDKAMIKLRRMVAGAALARQQAGFA